MAIICIKCSEEHVEIIRGLGQEIIYVCDKWDRQHFDFLKSRENLFKKIISVNSLDSIEELSSVYVDILEENIQIDAVISGAEYGIFAYGFLKTLFEKTSNGVILAINSRDKRAMKGIFKEAKVNHAKFYSNYSQEDFVKGVSHGLNYPLVVKPITGTGTFNTKIIWNNDELASYFENLIFHPALINNKVTLEEYIVGEEYHIDILWENGKPLFSSIGKYYIPRISIENDTKKNGSFILLQEEHEELYKEVISAHEKINQIIKFPNGVTHSEFFVSEGKIIFSEIAIRYGGARIPEMIRNTYGVDLIESWLKQQCGVKLDLNINKKNLKYSSWINLTPKMPGTIVKLPKKEDFAQFPWIKEVYYHMKEGDTISFSNPSEWACCIIFESDSMDTLIDKINTIYDKFEIVTK